MGGGDSGGGGAPPSFPVPDRSTNPAVPPFLPLAWATPHNAHLLSRFGGSFLPCVPLYTRFFLLSFWPNKAGAVHYQMLSL